MPTSAATASRSSTFRGDGAEVVLRPTGSIEVARARLVDLPVGGATPLAPALDAALTLAEGARRDGRLEPIVVVVTDGRATSGGTDPVAAAHEAADRIAAAAVPALVVDAETGIPRLGLAGELARRLGARCVPLDELTPSDLTAGVERRRGRHGGPGADARHRHRAHRPGQAPRAGVDDGARAVGAAGPARATTATSRCSPASTTSSCSTRRSRWSSRPASRRPHDFLVRDVLGVSVLVSRDADGVAHALLNYCRHRARARPRAAAAAAGSPARTTPGRTTPSGCLAGLPGAEGFDELDRADYGLVELPCEERNGLIWVVLTAGDPIDVAAHLGPLDAELAQWDLGAYEFFTEQTFDAAANWKSALEAFAENYHFPYVHGQSIVGTNTVANTAAFDAFGPHHRLAFPSPWIADLPDDAPTLAGCRSSTGCSRTSCSR